jgi:hypothetical protein
VEVMGFAQNAVMDITLKQEFVQLVHPNVPCVNHLHFALLATLAII